MDYRKTTGLIAATCLFIVFAARMGTAQTRSGQQLCRQAQLFSTAWTRADFKTMNRLLAPGYVHTDDFGNYQPRAKWLKVMHHHSAVLRGLKVTWKDIRIRMLGHGVAVLTGEEIVWHLKTKGKPGQVLRVTQVWTRGAEGWQRLAFQATPVVRSVDYRHRTCGKTNPALCTATVTFAVPMGGGMQHQSRGAKKTSVASCTFVPGPGALAHKQAPR